MAVSRPYPKRSPSLPANQGWVQAKSRARRPVRTNVAVAGGPRPRDEQPPLLVERDLSAEMAVGDHELDAIIRLLGSVLDDIPLGHWTRMIKEDPHADSP
jgi:hypothetical protein